MDEFLFSGLDYTLFVFMLALSALIGIYYGLFQKQSSANDYLLGGKQMNLWPVALSLASSTVSGLTLLAVPVDIYNFGVHYWLSIPLFSLILYISYKVYLPVFYKLQVTSTYEYFKLRFDKRIRLLASMLFIIYNVLYLPIVIYAPALALSQVTGINTHLITPTLCGVCIFYTTIGGIKAVIWTDALQFFVMIGSVAAVFTIGITLAGGVSNIWDLNYRTGRLNINFDFDPTKRDTFWTGTIGISMMWLSVAGVSQGVVQKCLSLPSFKDIRKALTAYFFAILLMITMCSFSGFIMFAKYFACDPFVSGKIEAADQLLPYYVMDVAHSIPGLAGLFVSGMFSAALSTLSASMNCLAATVYEDILSPFMPQGITEKKVSIILKCLVVGIGALCTALVFAVEKLGNILPLAFGFTSVTNGPLIGLFSVGMLVPMVNSVGAFVGGVGALIIMTWIVMTSQWYKIIGAIRYPSLPVFTDGCNVILNETLSVRSPSEISEMDEPFVLYRISFYYYTLIGMVLVFVISIAVSCFTKKDPSLNRDCISPIAQRFVKTEKSYYTIERATTIVVNHKG